MNADLVVVWDGGHRGVDADLLCVVSIVVKKAGETVTPMLPIGKVNRPGHHDERCARVVALLSKGSWFAVRAMASSTLSTEDEIYVVIQRLHRQGRIEKRVVPHARRERGQGWMEYRLKDVAASQVRTA